MLTKDKCKKISKENGYKLRTYVEHKKEVILFLQHKSKTLKDALKDFSKIGKHKFSDTQPDHFYIAMEIE